MGFFVEPLGHVIILRGQILVSRTDDDLSPPPTRVYVQIVPVCTGTTPTCVYTCGRVAGAHGYVLNVHTFFFSVSPHRTAPHRTAPHRTAPHHTTPHHTTPHHTTPHRHHNHNHGHSHTQQRQRQQTTTTTTTTQAVYPKRALVCVTCGGMDLSGQPMVARASGAAQRRKLRRLRAALRHEQQSIAMALASALHRRQDDQGPAQRPTGTEERRHRVLRTFRRR